MISYERLWETMKAKGITQYRLIRYYKFSAGQINRLKNNHYVSTHTLDVLCTILDCNIEDIMEFRLDPAQRREFGLQEPGHRGQPGNQDSGIPVTPDFSDEKK